MVVISNYCSIFSLLNTARYHTCVKVTINLQFKVCALLPDTMKIVLPFWGALVFSPLVHRVSVIREKWKTDHYMSTLTCHSAGLTTAMCPTHFARLLLILSRDFAFFLFLEKINPDHLRALRCFLMPVMS